MTSSHRETPGPSSGNFHQIEVEGLTPVSLVQAGPDASHFHAVFRDEGGVAGLYQRGLHRESGGLYHWHHLATMPQGYETSPCAALGTKIYVIGGSMMDIGKARTSVHEYDTGKDRWRCLDSPPWKHPIMGHTVVVWRATPTKMRIWVLGGYLEGGASNAVYGFDGSHWSSEPAIAVNGTPVEVPLCCASAAGLSEASGQDKLYLFGGYTGQPGSGVSTTLYEFDGTPPKWRDLTTAPSQFVSPAYWFVGAVDDRPPTSPTRQTLYLFINGNTGGSPAMYESGTFRRDDRLHPEVWERVGVPNSLAGVAFLGFQTYGVTTVPGCQYDEKVLFFCMCDGTSRSSRSVFAYFSPPPMRGQGP